MTTDPAALAREVLDAAHEDETITVCTIPDNTAAGLARAVIAVAELADRLEANASELEADGADDYAEAARTDAHRIRAALNGKEAPGDAPEA